MNHCRARLPLGAKPKVGPGPFGFPETSTHYCNQVVGVSPVGDSFACSIKGHREDVLRQQAQRYRDAQPWNDQFSIRDARPEWRMR
jgi:hypothetical protein